MDSKGEDRYLWEQDDAELFSSYEEDWLLTLRDMTSELQSLSTHYKTQTYPFVHDASAIEQLTIDRSLELMQETFVTKPWNGRELHVPLNEIHSFSLDQL